MKLSKLIDFQNVEALSQKLQAAKASRVRFSIEIPERDCANALYAAMQAAAPDPLKMGAVQTQYSDFNSAGVVLSNMAYNEQAQQYNEMARGFPASVIGALWNVKEVELFA